MITKWNNNENLCSINETIQALDFVLYENFMPWLTIQTAPSLSE